LGRPAADPEAGEVVCILDALDECEGPRRHELIERLCGFFDNPRKHEPNKARLKFLVTSRPYVDIERRFQPLTSAVPTVRLAGEEETESISQEIEKVIKAKVQEIGKWLNLTIPVRMTLEIKLLSVTHRTYLWLKLVFGVITEQLQVTEKRLLGITDGLPETVEMAYTAISDESTDRLRAKKLLHKIVAAGRPLSLREMNVALAVKEDSSSYEGLDLESEESFRATVRNLCGLFVSVINSRIFLIHQTAKEFLIREEAMVTSVGESTRSLEYWKHSLQPTDSNLILAKICISYLLFDVFESEPFILGSRVKHDAVGNDGAPDNEVHDSEATYHWALIREALDAQKKATHAQTKALEAEAKAIDAEAKAIEAAINGEIGIEVPNETDSESCENVEISVQGLEIIKPCFVVLRSS
jgi:hypothetical protein